MRAYIVGGAVRDALLGLAVKDRDWVVVGETPEAMIARGYRPVGRDFPVFLHPESHEEYALARTERKSGHGYTGFICHAAPDVTLEEDLLRRDLTINAIARDHDGALIDPHGGVRDLEARIFRHVSPAFAEDPLRILRIARFAARYTDFTLAPETLALTRQMVASGELDHLVAERVWQEVSRGLMEARPSRMIEVLRACGALAVILPELDRLFGVPQPPQYHPEIDTGLHVLQVIDRAARARYPLPVRWGALLHDLGKGETAADILPHHYGHEARSAVLAEQVSHRLKTPAPCREFATLFAREHGIFGRIAQLNASTVVKILERCDVSRRPERFLALLDAARCDPPRRDGEGVEHWPPHATWLTVLAAFSSVDAGALARACREPHHIPARIHAARVAAVAACLKPQQPAPTLPAPGVL
ncbi:multifunctional CCA protein [Betaproteobacteria bacterium]|nr:multifunctional CCA protein [Betaproteobacteria bacterium]GHU07378.1 multifunctional CCA protein [Betaproteobacteria bacterium]GHU25395.1 multifunctional CCA protein [Betaproteobacteria bacterium]GHU31766.1 multifunctional CCA protein [Betaproteobacteria bacterium]